MLATPKAAFPAFPYQGLEETLHLFSARLVETRSVQDSLGGCRSLLFACSVHIKAGPTLQPDEEQAENSLQPYLLVPFGCGIIFLAAGCWVMETGCLCRAELPSLQLCSSSLLGSGTQLLPHPSLSPPHCGANGFFPVPSRAQFAAAAAATPVTQAQHLCQGWAAQDSWGHRVLQRAATRRTRCCSSWECSQSVPDLLRCVVLGSPGFQGLCPHC